MPKWKKLYNANILKKILKHNLFNFPCEARLYIRIN